MANRKCSYKLQFSLSSALILFTAAVVLFSLGGVFFRTNHSAKIIHEKNLCEVIASNYYDSRCRNYRGSSYDCFKAVWEVFYTVSQDGNEQRLNARVEHNIGFRSTSEAENELK